MCNVYNTSGSLKKLFVHLKKSKINDFNSLDEIISFRKNYSNQRQEIISSHEFLIEEEKNSLSDEIEQLGQYIEDEKIDVKRQLLQKIDLLQNKLEITIISIPTNFLKKSFKAFKIFYLKYKIRKDQNSLTDNINYALRQSLKIFSQKTHRYEFINRHFIKAVEESAAVPLHEIDRKKSALDEVNSFIWGAIGEEKVVNELKKLSDEYYLINDFALEFNKAIYNSHTNDYIKSIQIDHIIVAPSGVYVIETKNWSGASISNPNLYSPVQQVRRASYALFRILNNKVDNLNIKRHRWGERKIPIRNIIALLNNKPKEEFQYVKILNQRELIGYIQYFEPVFSNEETKSISDYLRILINIS